jgi:hypothetical protein
LNWIEPTAAELAGLRADPLIFEQELDARPEMAVAIERALGFRAGRRYWRNAAGRLYALELGDFGRGHPSMAIVYGLWDRFEPRPVDDETIDRDLEELMLWLADNVPPLNRADVEQVIAWAWKARSSRPPLD